MVEKRPSPFNSPFARLLLGVSTLVFASMFLYSLIARDVNGIIATAPAFITIPWIAWNVLSGVQVRPGQSVGGGPMYPKYDLQRDETILFDAPVMLDGGLLSSKAGHLFVTNQRLIALPIRFYGSVQSIALAQVGRVTVQNTGLGWPTPRQSVSVIASGRTRVLRPWTGPAILPLSFMGMIEGDVFVSGVLDALHRAGCPAALPTSDF